MKRLYPLPGGLRSRERRDAETELLDLAPYPEKVCGFFAAKLLRFCRRFWAECPPTLINKSARGGT